MSFEMLDTPENIKDFPEGFIYHCCDGDANSKGCQTGRHLAAEDSGGRVPSPFSDSEGGDEVDDSQEEDEDEEAGEDEDGGSGEE